MMWQCPRCGGELTRTAADAIRCGRCGHDHPVIGDIPDLRVPGPSWVDHERDRAEARDLLQRFSNSSAAALVHAVFRARAGWTDARARARTDEVLRAPALLAEQLAGWLRPAAGTTGPLLDLGCGPGMLLAALGAGRPTIGIDVSLVWLVVARQFILEHGAEPALAAAMGEAVPLADESVGSVVSLDVVEHVASPATYLREIDRVLQPNGRVALSTPNRFSLGAEPHVGVWGVGWLPRRWQAPFVEFRSGQPYDSVALLSARELRRLFARNTSCECRIVAPPISDTALAHFPPYRRRLGRVYNAVSGSSIGQWAGRVVGPYYQVTGQKRPAAFTSTR